MAKVILFGSLPESLINFRGTLLATMVSSGHEVHAISMSKDSLVARRLSEMGVKYHSIPVQRTGINPFKDISGLYELFKMFRRIRPDYMLAYTIKSVIYGGIIANLFRVRFYAMITGMGYAFNDNSLKGRVISSLVRMLFHLSLSESKCVFFHNDNDLKVFQKACVLSLQDRCAIIKGSGVELDYYSPQPYPGKVSFLMIARLLSDKGVYEYVEAARQLKAENPNLQFRLAGWIDENPKAIARTELERWVYDGVIDYLGHLDDVRPAIANSSVYVLPSYHEGLPRTVLEAMAMGRPVITTDIPGCRDTVIEGKTGYLVKVSDADAIVSAMKLFLDDPDLVPKMGAESLRYARDVFDVRGVNQLILETMGLVSEATV